MLTGRDEQTALLREIVEQGRAQRHEHHHQPAIPGYEQFQNTQLPLFHKADEPVEADSWLRTIESKFTLHPYNDGDKAGFAAQQLRGPACTWWDNHMAMFPEGTRFTWAQFKEAFRAHHVPAGFVLFPDTGYDLGPDYPFAYLHERVLQLCGAEQLQCVDLWPEFAKVKDRHALWVNPLDHHPSAQANMIAAVSILNTFGETWKRSVSSTN